MLSGLGVAFVLPVSSDSLALPIVSLLFQSLITLLNSHWLRGEVMFQVSVSGSVLWKRSAPFCSLLGEQD